MKLRFYARKDEPLFVKPNEPGREWMDNTNDGHAYRCLPLNIANAHGWSFHLPFEVKAIWDGGPGEGAITFSTSDERLPASIVCKSLFGRGIITFYVRGLFQTEPDWDLYISGPPNWPLDGVAPLQGIVETDWSPFNFTMNWQITRPGHWVTFPKAYPYCSIFPVPHGYLRKVEPEIVMFEDYPELFNEHEDWIKSRKKFNVDLKIPESEARKLKWQKNYFRGKRWFGGKGPEDHITKLRLSPFVDRRHENNKEEE